MCCNFAAQMHRALHKHDFITSISCIFLRVYEEKWPSGKYEVCIKMNIVSSFAGLCSTCKISLKQWKCRSDRVLRHYMMPLKKCPELGVAESSIKHIHLYELFIFCRHGRPSWCMFLHRPKRALIANRSPEGGWRVWGKSGRNNLGKPIINTPPPTVKG